LLRCVAGRSQKSKRATTTGMIAVHDPTVAMAQ
jgi:hypothetical protein